MSIVDRSSRRDTFVILALTLFGAVLRFWDFGNLGLTHFDEGIYALAGLWAVARGGLFALDPSLIPYAPPGFPILVGLAYLVFGIADSSAILVSTVCGVATIPVMGWLGRRTFGPGGGGAASAFAAMSIAHVAFSRKAMTDAPFLLAWLIALGLGQRFLESPRIGRALAMGLAVGLAQNFKYNGWLAGAIVILTALLGLMRSREDRRVGLIGKTFGFGLLGALMAALVYAPWYAFVELQGGYASLLRHHRGYVGGVSTWYPHWKQQLAQVVALSGGLYWGFAEWCVAWLGCALAANGFRLVVPGTRWAWARFRMGLLGGATALAGMADLPWWVGLASVPWLLVDAWPAPRLIGVSWLVLSIMTPFYHPYARLWLPLHAAGWLITAGLIVRLGPFALLGAEASDPASNRDIWSPWRLRTRGVVLIVCVCMGIARPGEKPEAIPLARFYRPTTSFRDLADNLVKAPPVFRGRRISPRRGSMSVLPRAGSASSPIREMRGLRVLARRALVFYLVVQGKFPVQIESDSAGFLRQGRPDDWALLDRVLTRGDPVADRMVSSTATTPQRWYRYPVRVFEDQLDPVTLLDAYPEDAYQDPSVFLPRRGTISLLVPSAN